MDRDPSFRSSFLEWLGQVWERLEELDAADSASDQPAQSREFARSLHQVRRECEILVSSVDRQRLIGRVDPVLASRATVLLQDLRWLLEVSPAAAPALARQCVRMAQDRIFSEVQEVSCLVAPRDVAQPAATPAAT